MLMVTLTQHFFLSDTLQNTKENTILSGQHLQNIFQDDLVTPNQGSPSEYLMRDPNSSKGFYAPISNNCPNL